MYLLLKQLDFTQILVRSIPLVSSINNSATRGILNISRGFSTTIKMTDSSKRMNVTTVLFIVPLLTNLAIVRR
jgi:hypothetical protein